MEPIFHHLDQIFQVEAPQALGLLPVLAGLFGKHLGKPLGVRRQQAAFGDHHRHLAALEQVEVLVVLDQAVDLLKRNVGTVFHVHAACVDPAADRALGPATRLRKSGMANIAHPTSRQSTLTTVGMGTKSASITRANATASQTSRCIPS